MYKSISILLACIFSYSISAQDFIRRDGTKLIKGSSEIYLRGISFGNQVWENTELPESHHTEKDFQRVSALGMNAIRFYLNYLTFEDDDNPYTYKSEGWAWLDKNIAWAKANKIYLILNIHLPQGGFQSQCKGEQLWKDQENQDRLVALWKAIAQRYANEPQIAGFDLLNEPTPSDSIAQHDRLAQRLVDEIRLVDKNHLIIVANAIAKGCDYGFNDGKNNFPIIKNEQNLMYTIHTYDPYEYSHQNQAWAGTGEGGKYPDESIISAPSDLKWEVGQYNNEVLPAGNSSWKYYKGKPFQITSESYLLGRPVCYGQKLGTGKAYFDKIDVNEVDAQGNVITKIGEFELNAEEDLYFWSQNNDGGRSLAYSGATDNLSISVTGTSGYSTITAYKQQFKVEKGKYYAINGWMKGENIPSGAVASISMEIYSSPSGAEVYARNKEYLLSNILRFSQIPAIKDYPIYYGEFGLVRECFGAKGGQVWVKDVLDIFESLGYHFTYHDYREDGFGLYKGTHGEVDTTTANKELQKVFKDFFLSNPTGMLDAEMRELNLKVFPNPSSSSFLLDMGSKSFVDIWVYNESGKLEYSNSYSPPGKQISFGENLLPGVYTCRFRIDGKSAVAKIIKK